VPKSISDSVSFSRRIVLSFAAFSALCLFSHSPAAAAEKLTDLRGVIHASFNHDASRVVVRARDSDVGIWELTKGESVVGDIGAGSDGYLMDGDGKMVVIGYKDGHCRVFDATTGKAISPMLDFPLKADYQMPGLFSPTGDVLLLFNDKETAVFGLPDGKRTATIPLATGANEEATGSAAFTKDGNRCFVVDGSGTVTCYDPKTWKPLGATMRHPAAEMAYDFGFTISDGGKWLGTYDSPGENGPKGQLQVWDVAAGKPVGKPVVAVNGLTGRFLGDNRVLILPGRGEATVRELPSMKVVYPLRRHDDIEGPKADVSPDGKFLMAWGSDRWLDLVDPATGKLASNFHGPAVIEKVIMMPDSSGCYVVFDNTAFLLEGHHDHYVVKLSFPELKITGSLRILDFLLDTSLSSDGKRLLLIQGTTDKERLLFFDAATLKPLN
jgi:WD40 repeat protein